MTFNPTSELRKIVEGTRTFGGRKLSLREQCAAFAALYEGAPNRVVRRAFGISAQTASRLSGCLEEDPDPYVREFVEEVDAEGRYRVVERVTPRNHNDARAPGRFRHYETVAREFEALGKDQFISRYMTPKMVQLLAAAAREVNAEKTGVAQRKPKIDADGYPDFSRMNTLQTEAWRDANPEKWIARFGVDIAKNNYSTPIDKDGD